MENRLTRSAMNLHPTMLILACILVQISVGASGRLYADQNPTVGTRPVIMFWTNKPALVPHANYLTPAVSLEPARAGNPMSQSLLLRHGIMPLEHAPGQLLAKLSDTEILNIWSNIVEKGYRALGFDEFGSLNHANNRRFAHLLERYHAQHPDVYVAVWSAGIIDPSLAQAFRSSVNLVMIETYGPWGMHQFERFIVRLTEARLFGIVHKCIFAIGIDDAAPPDTLKSWGAWSNTPQDLEKQIRWIARHASDMAGIGFFAPYASDRMLETADQLAEKYIGRNPAFRH